jgi:hypothetical protein
MLDLDEASAQDVPLQKIVPKHGTSRLDQEAEKVVSGAVGARRVD